MIYAHLCFALFHAATPEPLTNSTQTKELLKFEKFFYYFSSLTTENIQQRQQTKLNATTDLVSF